jgi:hypothetical protein
MSFSSAHLPESAVPSIVRSAFSGSADRGTRLLICVNARGCHGQTLGSDAIQAPSRESTDELSPQVGLAWCARRGLWLGARAVRRRGSARLGLSDRPARTWVSREPGNLRVWTMPWLRTCQPDIRLGLVPARIVEARRLHTDSLRASRTCREQWRTACGAIAPPCCVAALGELFERRWIALRKSHCVARHDDGCRERATASDLAVAAVAIHHPKRWRKTFVAHRATRTPAGKRNTHNWCHVVPREKWLRESARSGRRRAVRQNRSSC